MCHTPRNPPTTTRTPSQQIILEKFSGLHLFQSELLGDNALYGVPKGSTWQGQPWQQRGDYRSGTGTVGQGEAAVVGGGLPAAMGVQPGVQVCLEFLLVWRRVVTHTVCARRRVPASTLSHPHHTLYHHTTQVGTYPMRVFGFDMDARLLPAAGCDCKKPKVVTRPSAAITGWPSTGDNSQGWNGPLVGLI